MIKQTNIIYTLIHIPYCTFGSIFSIVSTQSKYLCNDMTVDIQTNNGTISEVTV